MKKKILKYVIRSRKETSGDFFELFQVHHFLWVFPYTTTIGLFRNVAEAEQAIFFNAY